MMRFVYIGDQINEGHRDFTFYDTTMNVFANNHAVYKSIEDFEEEAGEAHNARLGTDRLRRLIPNWYREGRTAAPPDPAPTMPRRPRYWVHGASCNTARSSDLAA